MTWVSPGGPPREQGRFAQARAVEKVHNTIAHRRAVRTIAGHSVDAQDCLRLLAMLGLEAGEGKPDDDR